MSLPILAIQSSFDALNDRRFNFNYQGNQVFKNRLIVYKASDNSEIYNQIQTSFTLYHTLPANSLQNGIQYSAKLSIFDKDNIESDFSNSIAFTCHKTPVITINVPNNLIVQNSYLPINVVYSSSDGEVLDHWRLILYDSGHSVIKSTDIILASSSMGTTINGLENSKQYYVEVIGTTVNKMTCTTGQIAFSVTYIEPTVFSQVIATNIPEDGVIKVESHMIDIEGKSVPDSPIYINNNEVDLTTSGSKVWFDNGFIINGDFTEQYVLRNPLPYQICINTTNGVEIMTVKYMLGDFDTGEKAYFLLEVKNKVLTVRVATEIFDPLQVSQSVYLLIRRVNNLYAIKYSLKGG